MPGHSGLSLGEPGFKTLTLRAFKRMQFVPGAIGINANKLRLFSASWA